MIKIKGTEANAVAVNDEGVIFKVTTDLEEDDTVFVEYPPFSTVESLHDCGQSNTLSSRSSIGLDQVSTCYPTAITRDSTIQCGPSVSSIYNSSLIWELCIRTSHLEICLLIPKPRNSSSSTLTGLHMARGAYNRVAMMSLASPSPYTSSLPVTHSSHTFLTGIDISA
ncbi:hypothetical protein F5X97DRAFT_68284 [Nemania serpens]|nr:hypothetical protein F5X97DRAFT_68284 [Nemania serpens]